MPRPANTPKRRPKAPPGLSRRAQAFWRDICSVFGSEPHELELLRRACQALDRADDAVATIERDGAYFTDRFGSPKPRPAVMVERDSRAAFARLIAQLGFDKAEEPTPGRKAAADLAHRRWAKRNA